MKVVVQTSENRQLHKRRDEILALQHPFLQGSISLTNTNCRVTATAFLPWDTRALQQLGFFPPANPLRGPWNRRTPSQWRHGQQNASCPPSVTLWALAHLARSRIFSNGFAQKPSRDGVQHCSTYRHPPRRAPSRHTAMAEVIGRRPGPWTCLQTTQKTSITSPKWR